MSDNLDENVKAESSSKVTVKRRSRGAEIWRNFRKNKLALFGTAIILVIALAALTADLFFDYELQCIEPNYSALLEAPGPGHPLGTDELGRDILVRLVYGARVSLIVGILAVSFSVAIGAPLGAIAGFYGKKVDNVIMRCMDVLSALPNILLAITIVSALGQSLTNMLIAVAIANVPNFVRIVRSSVLKIKSEEYVEAARAIGSTDLEVIFFHILPNCIGPLLVHTTMRIANTILSIASLCFLGLGIKPPTPEWGLMLSTGRNYIRDAWWMNIFPGICIMLLVMGFNLAGDGLRDAVDPKMKK